MSVTHIQTFKGLSFTPLEPKAADIVIEDVAHALSNLCRFNGHVRDFYSVAEHSVRVSLEVERLSSQLNEKTKRQLALWGLLHDASEAYLTDLPTPLKTHPLIGVGYKSAEAQLMVTICGRFGLSPYEPSIVRVVDAALLATEIRDLMTDFNGPHWTPVLERCPSPLDEVITPWRPKVAEVEFLHRFYELKGTK